MKNYNVLCATLSIFILSFYSFCMEQQPEINNKKIISLITKIKIQQNILGYVPSEENACDTEHFKSAFEILAASDPKKEINRAIIKWLEEKAVLCINQIIYHYPLMQERIHLITEFFHNNSLPFLRKTIAHNEILLKQSPFFEYYQEIIRKKPKPIQEQSIPLRIPSRYPKTQQVIPLEIKETKSNEIKFTKNTYEGLSYNYQAYKYWIDNGLECNIYDPFINVDIIAFDENGNEILNKPDWPLPLPLLLNDDGTVKEEIFLPLGRLSSQKPFIVNDKNTRKLQEKLPDMALQFYKSIENKYKENDIYYLTKNNVIQKQDNTYIHGQNSCKPLLEKYFNLWGIPENEYKQIQEPLAQQEPKQPEEQEEPNIGWFAKLQVGITTITHRITNFFRNIYRFFFG